MRSGGSSQRDPLADVLDADHVAMVRDACAELHIGLSAASARLIAVELDRWSDPNAEAERMVGRRFRGVRGLTPAARPRRLPRSVANYLAGKP